MDGTDGLKAAVTPIALLHGLVTRYTSLLAVSETVTRPPAKVLESTRIAGNLPKGWTAPAPQRDSAGAAPRPVTPRLKELGLGLSVAVSLPKTATPAPLLIAVGLGLGLVGLVLLFMTGQRRSIG